MEYELILLAAGFSRRFGANKLLYPVDGVPMYLRAAGLMLTLKEQRKDIGGLWAVTRYPAVEEELKERGLRVVFSRYSGLGLSCSLQAGLRAALADIRNRKPSEGTAFCFFMGDQPYLTAAAVSGLLDRYPASGRGIGRLCHRGRPGNPAVFSEKYIPELLALTGDEGGRRIIRAHPEDVWEMEVADGRELADLDRPL